MDARNLTAIPHSDAGSLEVIVPMGMRPYVGQATGIRALCQMALSSTNRNSSYP